MKSLLVFALLFFINTSLQAQTFLELNTQFIELFNKGEYEQAAVVGEKAVAKAKLEFGISHANYAIGLYNLAEAYFNLGLLTKALPNYIQAKRVFVLINKSQDIIDVALINNNIGSIYYANEKFDSAVLYYNYSFSYFSKFPKDNYANLYTVGKNIVDTYQQQEDNKGVISFTEKLLPFIIKEKGMDNEDYYTMLFNNGYAKFLMGNYPGAEITLGQVLPLAEKLYGIENTEYASILFFLFRTAKEQYKFNEAEKKLIEAIRISTSLTSVDTITLVLWYTAAGDLYSEFSYYPKAIENYLSAEKWLEKMGTLKGENYISILQGRAYMFIQMGKLQEAKNELKHISDLLKEANKAETALAAEIMIVSGNTAVQLGELDEAETYATKGLEILNKLFKGESGLMSNAYEVLGMLYYKRGENNKSIVAYKEGLLSAVKFFGEESRQVASLYSNLGITYQVMGDYALAETVLKKSMEIRKSILGVDHPEYALSLLNLGMIHVMQGRYNEADKMLADAMNIYIKKEMAGTANFIYMVNNVALMEQKQGRISVAKNLYFRLTNILVQKEKENMASLLSVYNNLGGLYLSEKKYDSAALFSNICVNLLEKENKVQTTDFIKSANILMLALKGKGDYATANKVAKKLLPLCKQVMGDDAELLGVIHSNIAMLELVQGNEEKAAENLQASNSILLRHFKRNFYVLSEKEKLEWWDKQSYILNLYPSLLMQYHETEGPQVEAMVDLQLQLKGFVLQDASAGLRKARASASPAMLKLMDQWQYNKTLLSKLYSIPVSERKISVDSLEKLTNELEKQVYQSVSVGLQASQLNLTWKSVQASLQPGEAAVEYVQFPFYRNGVYSDTMQYAAIIIRKEFTSPKFILLASEEKLNRYFSSTTAGSKEVSINRLYRSSITKKESSNVFLGDSLYNLIWKPLMPFLQNISKVSFAPDGILHKVAFQALPLAGNSILIDSFQLQQYSGIRQLAEESNTNSTSWKDVYLLGNPDFNTLEQDSKPALVFSKGKGEWAALPGTANEIASLQKLFIANKIVTNVSTAEKASEASFKAMNNHSASIIHLATHGFFLRKKILDNTQGNLIITGEQTLAASDDPLLRSGIILAGANIKWSGDRLPDQLEDGIVSAYEISQLNLSATKLVVLSACETALGDVQGTEGVFGLQRAFKIAGVKNLIVSLWQVPDKETAELMTLFYTNLLQNATVRDAFYNAQKTMRSKYPPYMWAAFVLIE